MMTTITELDCGCRQKSKKPIFTTRSADVREYRCYRTPPDSHNQFSTPSNNSHDKPQSHNNISGNKTRILMDSIMARKNSPKHIPTFNTDMLLNMNDPLLQAAKATVEQHSRRRHTVPATKYNHSSTNTP